MTAARLMFDHLALPARDVQETLEFFGGVLGLPLVGADSGDDWGGHPWIMLSFGLDDGRQLALCVLEGAPQLDDVAYTDDLPHFGLAVRDEEALEGWRERLHESGVDFREEDHGDQQSLYFKDPSGIAWEITAPPTPAAAQRALGEAAQAMVAEWIAARGKAPAV